MEKPMLNLNKKVYKLKTPFGKIAWTNFFKFKLEDFSIFLSIIALTLFTYSAVPFLIIIWVATQRFPKTVFLLFIIYYTWVFVDRNVPKTTGRKCRSKQFRNLQIYKSIRNYFPLSLIKTEDLPPGRNYFLAAFPHAASVWSSILNFGTNVNHVDEIFPQMEMHYVAHSAAFFVPFLREYFLALGAHSSDESSIRNLLSSSPTKGVIIYPGGGSEMPHATRKHVYKINKGRKGFIRLAIKTGTPLVPVFIFGEIHTYDMFIILNFKTIHKKLPTGGLFLPYGRGIFQDQFGLLPRQYPIITVVGSPIEVPKLENPSTAIINKYHEKFYSALYNLFEEYKHSCDVAGSEAKIIMF